MGIFGVLKFWKKREDAAESAAGFPTGMREGGAFGAEAELRAPEFGTENPPLPGMSKFNLPALGEKMPSDEAGFGGASGMSGMSGAGAMPGSSGMPPSPEFRPFPTPDASTQGTAIEKDFAIVSAKLDTLKAKLELIEQKIEKIEKIAEESR